MLPCQPDDFTYQLARRRHVAARKTRRQLAPNNGSFKIVKRGRFWEVLDAEGILVCLTAYKKGAVEVARRLGLQ